MPKLVLMMKNLILLHPLELAVAIDDAFLILREMERQSTPEGGRFFEEITNQDVGVLIAYFDGSLGEALRRSSLRWMALMFQMKRAESLVISAEGLESLGSGLCSVDTETKALSAYLLGEVALLREGPLSSVWPRLVPRLVGLLRDGDVVVRQNVASALGNLTFHSAQLAPIMIREKAVPELLALLSRSEAKNPVRLRVIVALRCMAKHKPLSDAIKKCASHVTLHEVVTALTSDDSEAKHLHHHITRLTAP